MAKRKDTGAWLAAGAVFMVFALLAWALPRLVGAAGGAAWLLGGGLLLFGIAAAVILLFFLRARAAAAALDDETEAGDDIDHAFSSAEARLGAGSATDRKFGRLPLFLVLGPTGSTKSSVISHSGLDPELLAGEVFRADAVVPTEAVNLWYAQGTVIVEAGGRVLDDAPRWERLIRHLRPNRLAAALGRGRQAPRMALLCIGCDEFLKPGAAQSLTATARQLRARLAEASQQLGIPLPVYVLFTRADRLPFFTDYLRNFTTTEAQQVLGATLPLTGDPTGAWAERESHRLSLAFDRIVHSLGLRRLDVLARETQDEVRAGAYEFPRELRKIHSLAVQFMLDVFRPSQLGVNPFLRGFYFAGVRPIVVNDVAADAAPRPGPSAVDAGATSVFSVHQLQQAAMAAAPPPSGSRRVPQWVFLHRLFRDVILPDEAALGLTGGGTRVDLMRRALLTAAAAACLVFTLGLTYSFAGNRSLVRGSVAAVQGAREVGRIPGTLGSEDLTRLDTLREQTARLTTWQRDGRPVRLAWGLYAGDDLQRVLHPFYFDRFGDAIWFDARQRLEQYLRDLPPQPDENSDFGRAQAALAAHLITTTEFARSAPDQLAPVLAQYWSGTAGDDETQAIVDRQFAFFAEELVHGNPYDAPHDAALVERTQRFLRAFGREAYYNALIYEASSRVPPARYLGARNLVRNDVVIPGAFTLTGWRNVQSNLDSVDELFLRYQWIYGNQPPADKPQREDLAKLYVAEYIRRWQDYLAGGRVEPFTSISDAAAKLSFLGASGSPLFNMLAVASRETAMDSTTQIGRAFQPLHVTVAPEVDARAVTAGVRGYTNALTGLASTLNVLASGTPGDAARLQASTAAGDVKREASAIAGAFVLTGDAAATAGSIQRLLLQPANYTDALVSGLPAAAVNAAGSAFCATYAPVARRFPFSAQATANATVEEVTSIFRTNDGVLWAFYQDALESLMTTRGAPRAGARVRAEFRPFFSRAAEFSSALFSSGGGASLVFDFQPDIPAGASEVILQVDSDVQSYSPTMRASRSFDWQADRSRDARLIVVSDGQPITVASGEGPWAVFRLFNAASSWTGSGPYRVEWRIPGRAGTVVAQVSFESGVPPVLRPGYLAPISRCVAQVSN
jgi:type VI secretion system protein ImpL